ncbi:hypothetical protein IKP13_02045, partial [bacterium]|nr:hypothetical protein [bacterium]
QAPVRAFGVSLRGSLRSSEGELKLDTLFFTARRATPRGAVTILVSNRFNLKTESGCRADLRENGHKTLRKLVLSMRFSDRFGIGKIMWVPLLSL